MKEIRLMIANEMESKGISKCELAKAIGCGNSSITNVFNHKKELNFFTLLKIVRYLFPHQEQYIVEKYVEDVTKVDYMKMLLEYCSMYGYTDIFNSVIGKAKQSTNKTLNEWVMVYEFQLKCQGDRSMRKDPQYLTQLNGYNVQENELKIFIKIMESYYYYYNYQYQMFNKCCSDIVKMLESTKKTFFYEFYEIRLHQIQSFIELNINLNVKKCRELSSLLIDKTNSFTFKAFSHYLLGLSYFFDDYNTALFHLEKSNDCYKKAGSNANTMDEIGLLKFYWKRIIFTHDEVSQYFNKKNQLPYKQYLLGCLNADTDQLMLSMIGFLNQNNRFMAKLPKQQLIELGYNKIVLEQLHMIHQVA